MNSRRRCYSYGTLQPNTGTSQTFMNQRFRQFQPASTMNQQFNRAPWPKMTDADIQKYASEYLQVDTDRDGKVTSDQALNLFLTRKLPREVLKQVLDLSDQDNYSMLSPREFYIALYLMDRYREGRPLPSALPNSVILMLNKNLVSSVGPTTNYGGTGWEASTSVRSHHAIHGAQPVTPAGFRPPMQQVVSQPEGSMQFNQRSIGGPVIDSVHTNQLSNGGKNILDTEEQEAAETSELAENTEKMLLNSRDKLEFYRTIMQKLVLYRSRCDNRLNEIIERAKADKAEAESLEKKYQEKYNQLAEIHSKLAVEEAAFREIQARKSELEQAIIKMDQCGNSVDILQGRADRIESDLEELTKAFDDRCNKHSLEIKSPALIELPPGWQPGIPDVAAICDEDWDTLEDECFQDLIPSVPTALPLAERMSLCSIP